MTISFSQLTQMRRLAANENEQSQRALLRNIYLSQDNSSIRTILKQDLRYYLDGYDISQLKLITLDDYVKAFLDKISQVHKSPIIVKVASDFDKDQTDKFYNLLKEVNFQRVMQDTEVRSRLHNTILVGVRYFDRLDKMYLDNSFDASTTKVIGYPGFEHEERFVIREQFNNEEKPEWIIWDRQDNFVFRTNEEPKYDYLSEEILTKKLMIDENEYFNNSSTYFPFVRYQYQDQNSGFWGNGFDTLVELVRTINLLLTILADDTIAETLRILIMNFVPLGADGKPGAFKVGMRNPLIAETRAGEEASAEVISAELYTDDILKFVDKLNDMLSSMHGIDSVLAKEITADITATADLLRNEYFLNTWQKDIAVYRQYDVNLIKKLVEVNNFHRPKNKINEEIFDNIQLDYQSPTGMSNTKEGYELEQNKWSDGTSSPLIYVMRQNPEFSEERAKAFISDNIATTNGLLGITSSTGSIEVEGIFG